MRNPAATKDTCANMRRGRHHLRRRGRHARVPKYWIAEGVSGLAAILGVAAFALLASAIARGPVTASAGGDGSSPGATPETSVVPSPSPASPTPSPAPTTSPTVPARHGLSARVPAPPQGDLYWGSAYIPGV